MKNLAKALLLFAMLATTGASASAREPYVILTTACGREIDDQFAIAYLALIPEIHIQAIVTTHAPNLPKKAKSSADCVLEVIRRLGVASPPVFAGSDFPLAGRAPLRNDGVDFIVKTSRSHSAKNRLVIITIGAATDVASAFLADPSIAKRVEILTMG